MPKFTNQTTKTNINKSIVITWLIFFLITSSVLAKPFNVVVGLTKPPYVIQETNSGFEIELLSQLLTSIGKKPNFLYVPYGQSLRMLEDKSVDALMTVNTSIIKDIDLLSAPYVTYQNVVITLKQENVSLKGISDLSILPTAAFQTATKVLGEEYINAVNKNPNYFEVATQKRQAKLLYENKVNALVIDLNIFKVVSPSVGGMKDLSDVDIHYLFPKSSFRLAFKNKKHIKAFNSALAEFKKSTEYTTLKDKYNLVQ